MDQIGGQIGNCPKAGDGAQPQIQAPKRRARSAILVVVGLLGGYFAVGFHVFLFLVPLWVGAHLVGRRRWVALTVLLLLLPFSVAFVLGAIRYARGTATLLLYAEELDTESYNPDRQVRCPRWSPTYPSSGAVFFWTVPNNAAVRLMAALFGPMPGSYDGPYPTREEALAALADGETVALEDLLRGVVPIGEKEFHLDAYVGRAMVSRLPIDSLADGVTRGEPVNEDKQEAFGRISGASWRNRCLILRIPSGTSVAEPGTAKEEPAMIVAIDGEAGRPFAYFSQGGYSHEFPPVEWVDDGTSLDLSYEKAPNLRAVEGRTSLRWLYLQHSGVTDLGPLHGLKRLERLRLERTPVSDLSPLEGLPRLKELVLNDTQVTDLTPLAGIKSLEYLYLRHTSVSDLKPLQRLTKLKFLHLNHTRVVDLSPLQGLSQLESLTLERTRVSDFTPLAQLTGLGSLDLTGTKISDLAPLSNLRNLWDLSLQDTRISDLTPLSGLTGLKELDLSGTVVSNVTPLSKMKLLRGLYLSRTSVADLSPLRGLPELYLVVFEDTPAFYSGVSWSPRENREKTGKAGDNLK